MLHDWQADHRTARRTALVNMNDRKLNSYHVRVGDRSKTGDIDVCFDLRHTICGEYQTSNMRFQNYRHTENIK